MSRPVRLKEKIDAAAVRLFSEKGLASTTVKDIARESGVAEGLLYRYYSSKNEMAWKLFSSAVKRFDQGLSEILERENDDCRNQVSDAVRYIYQKYVENPLEISFILLNQHDFPDRQLLSDEDNPYEIVGRFVKKNTGKIIYNHQIWVIVATLFGAILQPLMLIRYKRISARPSEIVQQVIENCLKIMEVS